jgi:CBS domain-containing protein
VIATASPGETIGAVARRMAEYDVGTILVVKGERLSRAAGIVTDRDIALRGVAGKLDAETTPVSEIMTTPVQSVGEHTPVEEAVTRMASAGIRRLVVTAEGDRVAGILTLDDALDLFIEETAAIGRLLEKQKPRIPA